MSVHMERECKNCGKEYHNSPAAFAHSLQCENKRSVSEAYGDIRQAFDVWLNRAGLPDNAEWQIKDVQDALDKLAEFIPSRESDNA